MMAKTAVLINPGAGRGKGKGLGLASQLQQARHIDVHIAETFAQIDPIVHELMNAKVTRLFISAGDGTIDAVLTQLAESGYCLPALELCLLPHGTTNMTAADAGLRLKSISSQAEFISSDQVTETLQRHTMRIASAQDGQIRHGMFLGAGAVAEAARYSQNAFNARGIGGNLAPLAVLAKAVAKTLFTTANRDDKNRFDRPFPIAVSANGEIICDGPQLLAISTTLSKLILGSRPFWGDGAGAIRTTVLPYPFPNIIRWLHPTLFGTEQRSIPPGAISLRGSNISLSCPVPYILDGEFFEGRPGEPLHVETGPLFQYIVA
jgi:diacylglycerol kinase (ATP)